jgi:hypothetical protein
MYKEDRLTAILAETGRQSGVQNRHAENVKCKETYSETDSKTGSKVK